MGVGRGVPPSFALRTFGLQQSDTELPVSMAVVSGSLGRFVMEGLSVYGFKDPPCSVLHCRL